MSNDKETQARVNGRQDVSSSQDIIGKEIGDYRVIKEIGRGGMAVVYSAYQISLDRNVALKLIPQSLIEEPEYLQRFKREAASAARLNHPNIVSIHGFGQIGKTYYYIMDLAKGKTLDHVIEGKKGELLKSSKQFDVETALKITEQVASALSYAHKEGVIHRDIKPGNLIIDAESERVLITDFGLARSNRWEKITPRASLFGTPAYMSPEQASGKDLDQRTDIYSLGAVLYEMLTGKVPFSGDNALDVIDKVKKDPITSPMKINSAISNEVEYIILKAMSKDIRLRYQSMDDFLVDIHNFKKGIKITTFIRIAQKKIDQEKPKVQKYYKFIIFVIIALVAIYGVSVWLNYSSKQKTFKYLEDRFQLAENYENIGMKVEAVKIYKEIINDFPSSEHAGRAKKRLGME